jgi:hypothetical protein
MRLATSRNSIKSNHHHHSDYEERPPKDGVPGFQFHPDTGLPSFTVLACTSLLAAALATCAGENVGKIVRNDISRIIIIRHITLFSPDAVTDGQLRVHTGET